MIDAFELNENYLTLNQWNRDFVKLILYGCFQRTLWWKRHRIYDDDLRFYAAKRYSSHSVYSKCAILNSTLILLPFCSHLNFDFHDSPRSLYNFMGNGNGVSINNFVIDCKRDTCYNNKDVYNHFFWILSFLRYCYIYHGILIKFMCKCEINSIFILYIKCHVKYTEHNFRSVKNVEV